MPTRGRTKSFWNGLAMRQHAAVILFGAVGPKGLSVRSATGKPNRGRQGEAIFIVGSVEARFRRQREPSLIGHGPPCELGLPQCGS